MLIETKLYVPSRSAALVPRPRLGERLHSAPEVKLTLVSAPAGFGKTTLLAAWLSARASTRQHAAWLSLDQGDNYPTTFWTNVIAALRQVVPDVGAQSLSLLQSTQASTEAAIGALLNDLGALQNPLTLVLDDYHVIDSREIHEGLTFLLDHLPRTAHVVIASRADPPIPLARLRVRGELVEIRAADLRFTPDEAAAYLNELMGLDLQPSDVAVLEDRTEGWIAALQLAALSLRGRDDSANFITRFAGDNRYIVDYLVEEVLRLQSEDVRTFLVQTSILDRLSGGLCNAVTQQESGKATLEALERANLFVVPLDGRRQWYRYHHLFRDVLRAHLAEDGSVDVRELHRRASAWYARHDAPADAIHHAFAGEDVSKAADLIELYVPALARTRQEATLLGLVEVLPDDLLRSRPVLSNWYAGACLSTGQLGRVESRLRDAERWLSPTGEVLEDEGLVAVDPEQLRRLPGYVALHRAGYALALGDLDATITHARRALALAPEDDHLVRGGAAGLQGLAVWTIGDLVQAHQLYGAAESNLRAAGYIADTFGCAIALADIGLARGEVHHAMRTYEQALQSAAEQSGAILRGTADVHAGLSELLRERNDLSAAASHLRRAQELGEHLGLPQFRYRVRVAEARMREAEGDIAGALDLLDEAQRVYVADLFPNVRPVAALKARLLVRAGRVAEAQAWARERSLSVNDDLSYVREYEHVTLARVLAAGGACADCLYFLHRLLAAAEAGGRTGSVIDILIAQALATRDLVPLQRALGLAEPRGYVRVFVDEGPAMAALLEAAVKSGIASTYAHELVSLFHAPAVRTSLEQAIPEPLSERELDVLRLLGTDLDGPNIARELMVSLNTMRTHTKSIYAKLGVNSRRAAIRRAEELQLLRGASRS